MDNVSFFTEVQGWFHNPASLLLVQTSFNINKTRHKNRQMHQVLIKVGNQAEYVENF